MSDERNLTEKLRDNWDGVNFNLRLEAAAEIDRLRAQLASAMITLEDVPGETMNDRVMRIVEWHHSLAEDLRATKDQLASARKALEEIIDAEKEFREQMGADWEGDPVSDACDRAKLLLTDEKGE